MGAIHSTKIPTGPTGKSGPSQKVDPFFSKLFLLHRNFRKFWLNGTRPDRAYLIFRALRPCDQDSPISVWKPVYLLRAFVYHEWWATEGNSTPDSFVYSKGKHTFLEWRSLKNTWPFMRLIDVKEKARVFKGQARIQSSESDEREGEVLAWKHVNVVSFSRLTTVYSTLLCYNCQLKLAYSLVFIFYSCSSFLMKINHSHLTWLDPGESIPQDPKFGVEFKQ